MRLKVIDAQYRISDGKPIIYLLCRDENRKRRMIKVTGFEPYFYVPAEAEVPDHPAIVRVEETEKTTITGKKLKKIVVRVPKDVRSVRTFFDESFEADILFGDRFLIDMGIKDAITLVEEGRFQFEAEEIKACKKD